MASQTKTSEKTLDDLFVDELADAYDFEKRLVRALPKMAKAVNSLELKNAIEEHLRETEGHVQKLEQVFAECDMKPKAKKCDGMVGILEEGDGVVTEFKGSPAMDAAVIAAAQKVEHYEIATYGCLQEWAGMLGMENAAAIFEEILGEEKTADETLTEIARVMANEMAESGEDEESEDDESPDLDEDEEDEPSSRKGRGNRR